MNIFETDKYIVTKAFNEWENDNSRLYSEKKSNEYFPVFIISDYVGTPLAPFIKVVTKSDVNHSLISFDYKLKTMFSYGIRTISNKKIGGFQVEDIYTNTNKTPEKKLCVNVLFIPEYKYHKLKSMIKSFFLNKRGGGYSIFSLFDFITNKSKEIDDDSLVCSTFVNYCLKEVGIDLTGKPDNLISPSDLANCYDNKKCFNIYDGNYKNYSPKRIKNSLNTLSKKIHKSIIYDTSSITESTINDLLKYDMNMFYKESVNISDLHIESDKDLLKWMETNIKYKDFTRLMSSDDVYKLKKGSCHDQVQLEYDLLSQLGYKPRKLFFIEYSDDCIFVGRTHTLVYYVKGCYLYWFENAWSSQKGIHGPYKTISELKKDIINIHDKEGSTYKKLNFSPISENIETGITLDEYVKRCLK